MSRVPATGAKRPASLAPIPARFVTPRSTLLVDRFMTLFISCGGIGIILAVFAICVFIVAQVVPLFRGARVEPLKDRSDLDVRGALPAGSQIAVLGLDEWAERPFILATDGTLSFIGAAGPAQGSAVTGGKQITASDYDVLRQRVTVGTASGTVQSVRITYKAEFAGGIRTVVSSVVPGESLEVGSKTSAVTAVAWVDRDDERLVAAVVDGGTPEKSTRALKVQFGAADAPIVDLTSLVTGIPDRVMVDEHLDFIVVCATDGNVTFLYRTGSTFAVRQVFQPFADAKAQTIASAFLLFGDASLVFTNPEGLNRQFSLFIKPGEDTRRFGLTKEYDPLPAGASFTAISVRNKAFLIGSGHHASLRYGTSASIRWSDDLPFLPTRGVINAKYNRIALLDEDLHLHLYQLRDPHPEAGFRAFFGKVWYEGFAEPKYEWQSTGGSDDFEPKLSMVSLIFGTFKATFYTLLFAVPVALLAAIYTAEFMALRFKAVIKPAVEIMASLPSVVLGFLAALWLAPIIEERFPSVLLMTISVPLTACLVGFGWSRFPPSVRSKLPNGWEFLVLIPLLVVVGGIAWSLGPYLEQLLFTVKLNDGTHIADFRRWWTETTGLSYEQRNSLVLGVMMGFAVIPIIFTIAEDSLSNVPTALRSASLAMGASRWQTAIRIVVPTASAGIFSALMIGLGRAIGETMIVVMASGNTGIIDLNIFNGLRTLAANIAVELPEAPQGGTLYRALFLGALLLFIFTFTVNTVAEVMRARLREKYKTV